jgi:nucleoid-associated protein YgaU
MGKVEKLVVLTVLFLTAIVIAVTLRKTEDKPSTGSDPLGSAEQKVLAQNQNPGLGETPAQLGAAGAPAVLSSNLAAKSDATAPTAGAESGNGTPVLAVPLGSNSLAVAPTGLIKNTAGLRAGLTADLMVYQWKAGDAWSSVAQSIYGDARYETLLRSTNSDVKQPKAGESILVPTLEPSGTKDGALAKSASKSPELGAANPTAKLAMGGDTAAKDATKDATKSGGKTHTVKAGDSLSSISKQYYGTTTKWQQIAEANKTTLKDPNKLKVGMKLAIP